MATHLNSQPAKRSMSNIISSSNYCGTAPKINYSNIFRHRRVLIFRHSTWQWSIVGCLSERKKITSWKFDLILSIKCDRKVNEYDRRKRNSKPARTILNTICGTRESTRHWRDLTQIFYRFETKYFEQKIDWVSLRIFFLSSSSLLHLISPPTRETCTAVCCLKIVKQARKTAIQSFHIHILFQDLCQ